MNRRDFIKSAAIAAGLIVLSVSLVEETETTWTTFYVADWSEAIEVPIEHPIIAFRRAMKRYGYTKVRNLKYEVNYDKDRIAYFHVFSAQLG